MKKRRRVKNSVSTTKILTLGFFVAIVIGGIILMLPICSASGEVTGFTDAMFTATTSVCVTGLVTVPTFSHWNFFGQVIITILSQMGGLGIITFSTIFMMALGKKISLKDRLILKDAYNLDTLSGIKILVKRVVKGTLVVEAAGALVYMTVFVPQFGVSGIWKSIFNAVASFCNSGMDILGPDSLAQYVDNPIVCINTIVLVVLGGIGFPVWWTFIDDIFKRKDRARGLLARLKHMPLHTKVALISTAIFIFGGALIIFLFEYNNEATIGNLPMWQKIQASIFQSVTTRTAGFFTISQSGLLESTATFCCVLMFIGGSPAGTAGGVKTVTVIVLLATVWSILRGKKDTEILGRKIRPETVRSALSIFTISFVCLIFTVIALTCVQHGRDMMDCLYEATSAIATVGLTRDYTSQLTEAGKWIIILTMFIGRIGPISLALFFDPAKKTQLVGRPVEDVHVG